MTKAITAKARVLTDEEKFDLKLKLTTTYYSSPRDDEFIRRLCDQTNNFRLRLSGGGVKEVALVVMGPSDSGKSRMLDYHLATYPELQPKMGEDGVLYSPLLYLEAPGTCSNKSFMIAMLAALHVPASPRATEFVLHAALKRILKHNKIECVVIDEMQHTIRGTGASVIAKVQDVIKSMLQIDDWPIHFVFVGTQELARFLQGDRQLANRCNVMRLHDLDYQNKDHMTFVDRLLNEIVVETAGLTIGWTEADKLAQRLTKASNGALGAVIKFVRLACIHAIDNDLTQVTIDDFAECYRVKSGCTYQGNIFRSVDWKSIDPSKAVDDLSVTQ
ncbi:TniB family NTP-binding protein [Rhizobium sp. 2YAF20]|uniref:TniB family NTP-binding protein n=1 Tax=Rhizobium sp. 2YAF20 TaxID=3233027 RepID=UPI003F9C2A71